MAVEEGRTYRDMRAVSFLLSKAERVPERKKAKERKGSGQNSTLRMLLEGFIFLKTRVSPVTS